MPEPYGVSAGDDIQNSANCPTFMPGHRVIGRLATFDNSRVICPEKPGSMKPAVECVNKPKRPNEDFPSKRPAKCAGSVNFSSVAPNTNSPGCSTNGSFSGTSTRLVRSSCCCFGSMCVYFELLNTRKKRSMRTSTLDGWTKVGSYGSMIRSPLSTAARISRSERSTLPV